MTMQTLRTANVFDGMSTDGRPLVDRKPLGQTEVVNTLTYLEPAPIVHPTNELNPGRVDGTHGQRPPLTWQTGGDWVCSARFRTICARTRCHPIRSSWTTSASAGTWPRPSTRPRSRPCCAAISGGNRPTCCRRGGRSVIDYVDREFGRPGLDGER
jgi:hypothetical protein